MTRPDLHTREWRDLPRDGDCVAEFLFGEAAGPCHGVMHRHHVRPSDPTSRTYLACASHHPVIEAFLRRLLARADRMLRRRSCPHRHVTREAREQCERRLNRAA
jgi:hypothetical protein